MTVAIRGLANRDGIRWTFDGEGKRNYRLRLVLKVTTAPNLIATAVAVYDALVAAGYYQGSPCPLDAGAICTEVTPTATERRDSRPMYWEWTVDVAYSSRTGDFAPSNTKDPTARPPVYDVSVHTWTDAATTDVTDGSKVQNSGGDPQVRKRDRSRVVLSVDKNYDTFDMNLAQEAVEGGGGLLRSRHKDPWTFTDDVLGSFVVGAGMARLEDMRIAKRFDNNVAYAAVHLRIEFDKLFWADRFADQGFFYTGNDTYGRPQRYQFMDANGGFSPQPRLLDGNGGALAANAAPVIRSFKYYPTADWAPLALPGM